MDASGSTDHTSIGVAVNSSSPGDVILVMPGTYRENVTVHRRVSIVGWREVGQNVIIDGLGGEYALRVTADGVNISGISAVNAHTGILVISNDTRLTDCTCTGNLIGIGISNCSGNLIRSCNCSGNGWVGISLGGADHTAVSDSVCDDNGDTGIHLFYSSGCDISNTTCRGNRNHGIYTYWFSDRCTLSDLTCTGSAKAGIYVFDTNYYYLSRCNSSGNPGDGIYFMSTDSIVENCTALDNDKNGLHLYHAEGSEFRDILSVRNEMNGMLLKYSGGNIVERCFFGGNGHGMKAISSTSGNILRSNSFLSNGGEGAQATDEGDNTWNTIAGGNHWSDHIGPDADLDGIVDSPYALDGEAGVLDRMPLTAPPFELPSIYFTGPQTPCVEIDTDGDGWNDTVENTTGSDPLDPRSTPEDLDGDGHPNEEDDFPEDPYRWRDVDISGGYFVLTVYIIFILILALLFVLVARRISNTRSSLLEYIKRHPGSQPHELARVRQGDDFPLENHLGKLEGDGKIYSEVRDGCTVYFPAADRNEGKKPVVRRDVGEGNDTGEHYRVPCRCGAEIDIYTSKRPTTIKCSVCGAKGLCKGMGKKVEKTGPALIDAPGNGRKNKLSSEKR